MFEELEDFGLPVCAIATEPTVRNTAIAISLRI
jgi:hypothetical protein